MDATGANVGDRWRNRATCFRDANSGNDRTRHLHLILSRCRICSPAFSADVDGFRQRNFRQHELNYSDATATRVLRPIWRDVMREIVPPVDMGEDRAVRKEEYGR